MKSFGSKPWMLPQPVLIIGTYNEDGTPNAMNAAWGGQWDRGEVMISMGAHATTENLARCADDDFFLTVFPLGIDIGLLIRKLHQGFGKTGNLFGRGVLRCDLHTKKGCGKAVGVRKGKRTDKMTAFGRGKKTGLRRNST